MGTKALILDLLQSYIDNVVPYPLKKHANYKIYGKYTTIEVGDYNISCAYNLENFEKSLEIFFFNGFLADDKDDFHILMTYDDICIVDDNIKNTFIAHSDIVFNYSVIRNFTLNINDLEEIHNKYIELCDLTKNTKITKMEIYYTIGEEKQYGYR